MPVSCYLHWTLQALPAHRFQMGELTYFSKEGGSKALPLLCPPRKVLLNWGATYGHPERGRHSDPTELLLPPNCISTQWAIGQDHGLQSEK